MLPMLFWKYLALPRNRLSRSEPLGRLTVATFINPYHSREAALLLWNQTLFQAERCLKCTYTRWTI